MPRHRRTRLVPLLTAAAILLPLAACDSSSDSAPAPPSRSRKPTATPPPRTGDQRFTLLWKGEQRHYTVHSPPGRTGADRLPLVIALHPYPSDGETMAAISGLNTKADKENFLVAYPDGLGHAFNALVCCGTEDDVGFLRTITKKLTGDRGKADPRRVYVTGVSNGAEMAYRLAVELPGTFAAIAPVSGGYLGPDTEKPSYMPKTPVSVLTFIGGLDEHDDAMNAGITTWRKRLGCVPRDRRQHRNSIQELRTDCRDGSEVVVYRLPKMGHA
ncbi:alpha/beta hydrolase family esterase [Streptomyces flavofungini]|uniref:alpha/beta hydrolase family esterase n=1 Tax=Streptomyces flavofungini TaxID=68200 RepID=UPI0034DF0B85